MNILDKHPAPWRISEDGSAIVDANNRDAKDWTEEEYEQHLMELQSLGPSDYVAPDQRGIILRA